MLLRNERELIVEYGKKMVQTGLIKGTGGNISIYNRKENLVAISPSGLNYYKTKPEDIVLITIEGKIVDGQRKPSTELAMHTIFYKNRKDIHAIVHTHSPYASTISALHWDIPAATYLVARVGLDIRCSKYATFGTEELAQHAYEAMLDRKAVLLANHGLLAGGHDLESAFSMAEEVEYCAEIYYRAKSIGNPIIIPEQEMKTLIAKFQ